MSLPAGKIPSERAERKDSVESRRTSLPSVREVLNAPTNPELNDERESTLGDGSVKGRYSFGNIREKFGMKVADSNAASGRNFTIETIEHSSEHCTNLVRTAKYSIFSFIPVILFNQFQRVANIYFLFIAILQFIPGLSPTHWSTTVAPLVGVLTVNAVKEGYDDYFRHKSDKEVNNREVNVLRGNAFDKKFLKDLLVGDIIRIHHSEESPADIAILLSGHEESIAYVETSNLDGETALKLKMAVFKESTTHAQEIAQLKKCVENATVTAELPNNDLYRFKGVLKANTEEEFPLDPNNLILRGSSLKNTNWVMGVVVYAGKDSKILLNMTDAPHKVSQLERHMNVLVACIFTFLGVISVILGVISNSALAKLRTHWYMESEDKWPSFDSSFINIVVQAIRFIILLNQFIPISLYVTLELVKVIQCFFLNVDRRMYHKDTDTRFMTRTTSLNEELGQIEYVLSDKTGTLTQNVMEFVGCSIAGEVFDANEVNSVHGSENGSDGGASSIYAKHKKTTGYHSISSSKKLKKHNDGIYGDFKSSGALKDSKRIHVDMFLKALVLCNTVTTIDKDIQKQLSAAGKDVGEYMADSPDEEALVEGVSSLGYTLTGRTKDKVYVTCPAGKLEFSQLALLGFSSERKRMSSIYRTPEGKIVIVSKGADQVMLPRCKSMKDNQIISPTKNHLKGMGMSGYRTLVVGYKEITEAEFEEWNAQYQQATLSMENRTAAIEKCADVIENDLILLGATAVEDKLQDGVPETISMLLEAGLHVWILTGDKLETSLSVALSSMLLTDIMPVVIFRDDQLINSESEVARKKNREIINAKIDETQTYKRNDQKLGLVIEGGALTIMLKPEYQESLLLICKLCNSVICCRMSPLQKAEVTKLVKDTGSVTLAIGDGANDAGMIQSAHVGVGISGREGRAAVLASDFAMAQFRFLSRLLLVHGRWSFLRNREVVLYAFYKNIAYCFPNILLACLTGVSTQPLYSAAFIATHNVCWTSLPTLANATLEQDVNPRTVVNNPDLYKITSKAGRKNFFRWTAYWLTSALWHAMVIVWVPFLAYINHDGSGKERGMWFMGAIVYTCAVIVVNLKLAMRTRYWTWITHFLTWGSIVVFFAFLMYVSSIWETMDLFPELFGVASVFSQPTFWLVILCATVMCLCFDMGVDAIHRTFYPNMQHFFQQLEYLGGGKQPVSSLQSTPIHTPRQSRSNSLALSADSMDSVPSLPSVIQVISS